MSYDVALRDVEDAPAFAQKMAETLASGREFAVWIESDAGDERLAYTVRLDGGAYRVRDGDLSDVGTFADVGAALREAQRFVDGRL